MLTYDKGSVLLPINIILLPMSQIFPDNSNKNLEKENIMRTFTYCRLLD